MGACPDVEFAGGITICGGGDKNGSKWRVEICHRRTFEPDVISCQFRSTFHRLSLRCDRRRPRRGTGTAAGTVTGGGGLLLLQLLRLPLVLLDFALQARARTRGGFGGVLLWLFLLWLLGFISFGLLRRLLFL